MDNPTARSAGTTTAVSEGVEIWHGRRGDVLRLRFRWQGKQRRETLKMPVTPKNIIYAQRKYSEILNAIERNDFDYAAHFPTSRVAQQQHITDDTPSPRFGDLLDQHSETMRLGVATGNLSPSTLATYMKWIRARVRPKLGDMRVDEIKTKTLRDWMNELVKSGLSAKSIRNVATITTTVLMRAVDDELIGRNPFDAVKLKTLVPKKRRNVENEDLDPFNADEIGAILAACESDEERAFFGFLFSTGVRPGEAMALKWKHIDWRGHTARIIDNVVDAEVGTTETDTKTAGSTRTIVLIPAALAALETMRARSQLRGDLVFLNRNGVRWRDTHQIRSRWAIVLRRAGVRYRTTYQTRHTFASTLLMAGENELLVARLLGHNSVEMIRRTYGRYIPKRDGITLSGDYGSLGGKKLSG